MSSFPFEEQFPFRESKNLLASFTLTVIYIILRFCGEIQKLPAKTLKENPLKEKKNHPNFPDKSCFPIIQNVLWRQEHLFLYDWTAC